jgi:hypothetical protein
MIALIVAALVAATPATPPSSEFEPFYVGPAYPIDAANVLHIVVFADTPEQGRLACLDELAWSCDYDGQVDCRVEPRSAAPDPTQPGWALPYGPGGSAR